MLKAAQLMVFALVLRQGYSAIDDVFRQVQEDYDDSMDRMKVIQQYIQEAKSPSGQSSGQIQFLLRPPPSGLSWEAHLQSDWCRYKMKGSNRTLVKLHYDMVIDERTYKDAFRCPGKLTIMKAMEDWGRYTCLHFVQRKDQYDRIIFSPVEGVCESYVGRIIGPQYISLDPENCMTLPIILHEIGHAIGLYHEHTRVDRDNNVIVNYKHIEPKNHRQFDKDINKNDFNKTYDYNSIMHYGKNFFANPRNAISLEPTDKVYLDVIGKAQHLSFHDVQIVNAMYNCKEKCVDVECPEGSFVGKNCECFCQGLPKDPVQRCNNPKKNRFNVQANKGMADSVNRKRARVNTGSKINQVFCEPPAIDLATHWVSSIGGLELLNLTGTRYPDGTVLIVEDPRCSEHGQGNYTCQDGKWLASFDCKPDRCVYNTSRYDFKPNITADGVGRTTDYVNTGKHVHVECVAPKGIPSYDSECTESLWVPELPNCEAVVNCKIENFDFRNVEVLFQGRVKTDGDVVPDASSVVARCKGSNQQNIPKLESQSALVCNKGQLEGQIPTQCPTTPVILGIRIILGIRMAKELYACPIVEFAYTSGPFDYGYDVKCFNKYEMQTHVQEARFQCDWRGIWKPFVPRCIPESCHVMYDIAKTEIELMDGSHRSPNSRISSGQTISMACKQPGHVPDHLTVTCEFGVYKETSDKKLPLCKPESCQVMYDTAKAKVKLMDGSNIRPNSIISSGQMISMACKQRGHVPDHSTVTCEFGVFKETGDKTLPLCKPVTCEPPPLSDAVVYTPMNSTYLFKASVGIQRCTGKLWFQGDQRLTCTANGTWNGTAKCTPYCQHGTEKLEERQNLELTKHTIKNITVESYKECLTYCKNYDRILCRAFAYGFDQGRRRCHITYVDPSRHTDMVGVRQLWSVWIRKCD